MTEQKRTVTTGDRKRELMEQTTQLAKDVVGAEALQRHAKTERLRALRLAAAQERSPRWAGIGKPIKRNAKPFERIPRGN